MIRLTRHLKKKNIGYFSHMLCAIAYSVHIYTTSLILLIHAIFPFIFEETGSKRIKEILKKMDG